MSSCGANREHELDDAAVTEPGHAIALRDTLPPSHPIGISFGSSFGMCHGYCWHEYTLHRWGITGVRRAGVLESSEKPDQRIWARVPPDRMDALLAMVDTMDLGRLNEVTGCGDCKDGGACWLKIERPGRQKVLSYECVGGAGHLAGLLKRLWDLEPSPASDDVRLLMSGMPHWD